MESIEVQGKTVEEAVESGLEQLKITREEADIVVLEEPSSKGLIFKKSTPAIVKISKKLADSARAVNFLEGLFDLAGIHATTKIVRDDDKICIDIIAPNSSSLIGYRGEILDSLQNLAGAVANIGRDDYKRVVVDCEGYRAKREETLNQLAKRLADKAVRMGRKVVLEPMPPFERRIIHTALMENTNVKTQSEDKEPNRHIVIIPNELRDDRPLIEDRNKKPMGKKPTGIKRYGDKFGDKKYGDKKHGKSGYSRDRRERAPEDAMYGKPKDKHNVTSYGTFIGNSHEN